MENAEAAADATDTAPTSILGRRTRQQALDEMYDTLEQLARENCEINKNNTSHEHHRLKRAMQMQGSLVLGVWTGLAWS
jgi:hypothetical protein